MRNFVVVLALLVSCAGRSQSPTRFSNPGPYFPVVERERELQAECATRPQACAELGERKLEAAEVAGGAPLAAAYLAEACARGSGRGCAGLAVLRAEGRGMARDEARATTLARRACEAGAGNGCVTWARLLGRAGPLAAISDARESMKKGCALGLPDTCAVVERLADRDGADGEGLVLAASGARPSSPGQVAARSDQGEPEEARKELGAGSWAEVCAEAHLERGEREALGLGSEVLARALPTVNDLRMARPLGEVIGRAVAGCVCPPGAGITVALRLGDDGRAHEVRATRPEAEACVRERIGRLDLPAPVRATGLLWWDLVDFRHTKPFKPADPGVLGSLSSHEAELQEAARERGCPPAPPRPPVRPPDPAAQLAKYAKPREVEKGCAGRAVGAALRGSNVWARGSATVKFAVGRDGKVSRFEVIYPDSLRCDVVLMMKKAIQSCAFEPGRDALGKPQLIWMVLPLRFSQR